MELHPRPQLSLWFCFLSLFEAHGVKAMVSPLPCRMHRFSPLLLLSFLSQRCKAAGRTLPQAYLPKAGLVTTCFLQAWYHFPKEWESKGDSFNYTKASNWEARLSLNIVVYILCYSHYFCHKCTIKQGIKNGLYLCYKQEIYHCTWQRPL